MYTSNLATSSRLDIAKALKAESSASIVCNIVHRRWCHHPITFCTIGPQQAKGAHQAAAASSMRPWSQYLQSVVTMLFADTIISYIIMNDVVNKGMVQDHSIGQSVHNAVACLANHFKKRSLLSHTIINLVTFFKMEILASPSATWLCWAEPPHWHFAF